MKLYTEEQIRKYLLDEGIMELFDLENNLVPHIELPSDEEIDKTAVEFAKYRATTYEISAFIIGAKMVTNKIQGGNK
jgi:hypothetical protein